MNRQQRRIVTCALAGLSVFSFVMAFQVPFVEFGVFGDGLIDREYGPDVLVLRARHRKGRYSKEYLHLIAERADRRIEEERRQAEEKGLTITEFWQQNPPSSQERWEAMVSVMLDVGGQPTEPQNLTLSLLAGIGLPLLLLATALFVRAGGQGKPTE